MSSTIKAITIQQPYASLIALGIKHFETRSWKTQYRGRIAIHAGKTLMLNDKQDWDIYQMLVKEYGLHPFQLPMGCVIGYADLTECYKTTEIVDKIAKEEKAVGFYTANRWAWKLENFTLLEKPDYTVSGKQGLWNYEPLCA